MRYGDDDFEDDLDSVIAGNEGGTAVAEKPAPKKGKKKEEPVKPRQEDDEEEESQSGEETSGQVHDPETIDLKEVVLPDKLVRTANSVQDAELDELEASIRQDGLLNPIIVNHQGVLVAGLRRFLVFKKMKEKEIPCITLELNEDDVFRVGLVENVQRKNMSIQDFGDACNYLLTTYPDSFKTQKALAKRLGVSEAKVTMALQAAGHGKSTKSFEGSSLKVAKEKKESTGAKKTKPAADGTAMATKKEPAKTKRERWETLRNLPDDLTVSVSKTRLRLGVELELPEGMKRFDLLKSVNRVLLKVKGLQNEITAHWKQID